MTVLPELPGASLSLQPGSILCPSPPDTLNSTCALATRVYARPFHISEPSSGFPPAWSSFFHHLCSG